MRANLYGNISISVFLNMEKSCDHSILKKPAVNSE
jgi:hypothetical protein